jgi:hypothetical protein
MNTQTATILTTKCRQGLHFGLIGNGCSAFLGALATIGFRTFCHRHFLITVDCWMQINIASGAALISYLIVALERRSKGGYEILTVAVVTITGIMALKHSTAEWRSVQTLFALTSVMKPLSGRCANYLSPMPVGEDYGPRVRLHASSLHSLKSTRLRRYAISRRSFRSFAARVSTRNSPRQARHDAA